MRTYHDCKYHRNERSTPLDEEWTSERVLDIFGFSYRGFSTTLTSLRYDHLREIIYAKGHILRDGERVGEWDRDLHLFTKEVQHSGFTMRIRATGAGFGKKWIEHCLKMYKIHGFDSAWVDAGHRIGGYAWASMGFDFEHSHNAQWLWDERGKRVVKQALKEGKISKAYATRIQNRFQDTLKPIDIACMGKHGKFHIGKKILMGSHYEARIKL